MKRLLFVLLASVLINITIFDVSAAPARYKAYKKPLQYNQLYTPKTYQNSKNTYIKKRNTYEAKVRSRIEKNRIKKERIRKKKQAKIIRNARKEFNNQQNQGIIGGYVKTTTGEYKSYRYVSRNKQQSNKRQFFTSLKRSTAIALTKTSFPENKKQVIKNKIRQLQTPRAKSIINENRAKKIFGSREGHIPDTPRNRKFLQDIANDTKTTLGSDKYGNVWSGKVLSNGEQAWTQTRNGEIINGGVNKIPRIYNPETGLSSPTKSTRK